MTITSSSARRIMVVEDNPVVTRALAELLRQDGFDPVVFHAAQPALDFAAQPQATGAGPLAAALVDIHLPGLSGLDLSRELRKSLGVKFPIIILSGDTSIDTLRALADTGATYFYPKPVNAHLLLQRIKECAA